MRINKSLLCLSFLLGLGLTSCGNANNQASSKEPEGPKKAQVIVMSGQSNMEGSTLWGEGEITSSDATDVNPAHGADDNWLEKAFNDLELEDDVNDYIEGNVPEIQMSFRCFYPYENPYKLNASNMENDGMDGEFKNLQVGMANRSRFIGPEIGMATVLREKASEDTPIFFIKSAYGGSSLGNQNGANKNYIWRTAEDGNGTEGKLWTDTKTFVDNNLRLIEEMGYEPEIKAWCWHQGESDGSNSNYGTQMGHLVDEFRDYFKDYAAEEDGDNIAFIDCTIYDGTRIGYNAERKGGLNDMKIALANSNENNYIINGSTRAKGFYEGLDSDPLNLEIGGNSDLDGGFNKYHYITKDCVRLGRAYGEILIENGIIE